MIRLSLFFVAHEYQYYRDDPTYTVVSGPYISAEQAKEASQGVEPQGKPLVTQPTKSSCWKPNWMRDTLA